jgi:hypothetical protein
VWGNAGESTPPGGSMPEGTVGMLPANSMVVGGVGRRDPAVSGVTMTWVVGAWGIRLAGGHEPRKARGILHSITNDGIDAEW